jgi:hypothetical protein
MGLVSGSLHPRTHNFCSHKLARCAINKGLTLALYPTPKMADSPRGAQTCRLKYLKNRGRYCYLCPSKLAKSLCSESEFFFLRCFMSKHRHYHQP